MSDRGNGAGIRDPLGRPSRGRGAAHPGVGGAGSIDRRCAMTTSDAGHPDVPSGAPAGDGRDDFNFLLGTWRVENRRLQRPLDPGDDSWEEFSAEAVVRSVLN